METTKTIKGIEVIAYKGIGFDMTCREFKYELGKSYKTDKVKLCEWGFHACLNPLDVLEYYSEESSRYFKVLLSGEITKCDFDDTKVAATEITILEEINIDEIINNTEWWKHENVLDLLYFSDGFAKVKRRNGEWNFIDKQGNYLSDEWFEWAFDFNDGFARVRRGDNLYNFINKDGKILTDEWFNYLGDFRDGFAIVQRSDKKHNFINKQGKYLTDEWFNYLDDFRDGFAKVQRSDKQYNFIDTKGKILSDEWYNWVGIFHDGLATVQRTNGKWCNIDKTGTLIKIQ